MGNSGVELSTRELSPPSGSQPLEGTILLGAPSTEDPHRPVPKLSSANPATDLTSQKIHSDKGQDSPAGLFGHSQGEGAVYLPCLFLGNELSLQTPKTWMEEFSCSWGTTTGYHLRRHEWSHGGNNHRHFTLRVSWPIHLSVNS